MSDFFCTSQSDFITLDQESKLRPLIYYRVKQLGRPGTVRDGDEYKVNDDYRNNSVYFLDVWISQVAISNRSSLCRRENHVSVFAMRDHGYRQKQTRKIRARHDGCLVEHGGTFPILSYSGFFRAHREGSQ